jgi:hypothetical protein
MDLLLETFAFVTHAQNHSLPYIPLSSHLPSAETHKKPDNDVDKPKTRCSLPPVREMNYLYIQH